MICGRCDDTHQLGLPSLSIPCPDCARSDAVDEVEKLVRDPRGFARLCAHIGYSDAECVTAIVSKTDLTAEEAQVIVDEEYQGFAEREANNAAADWLREDGQ